MLGIALVLLGSIFILFVPETLEDAKVKTIKSQDDGASGEDTMTADRKPVLQELIRSLREFTQATRFIWIDKNVRQMVLALFVTVMSRQSTNMLMQYASKKFHWSIARVSFTTKSFYRFPNILTHD